MNRLLEISTFCALVLTLVACVDTIPIEDGPVESMIVLESGLKSNSVFEAKLSTSAGYHDVTTVTYPENAKIIITWGGLNFDGIAELSYFESCRCYRDIQGQSAKVNIQYAIEAKFEEDDMPSRVVSKTTVPKASTIDSSRNELMDLEMDKSRLRSSLIIDEHNREERYYHVIAYRYELEKYGPNDEPQYKRTTGEKQYLRLSQAHTNSEVYLEQLENQEGFLVDMNNVEDALVLDFELETPHAINIETDKFKDVYYELRSVNEAYYRYNLYRSREYSATTGNQVSPAISYSNINSGLGFFGGYSSKIDSFLVY